MTSVSNLVASGSSSSQAQKLALLTKLFQTTGKSSQEARSAPAPRSGEPPPPPPPSGGNSAGGLASMFAALMSKDTADTPDASLTDLVSKVLQAMDSNGDGTISDDEMSAFASSANGPDGPPPAPPPGDMPAAGQGISAYEMLFKALNGMLADGTTSTVVTPSARYASALSLMAQAA